MNRRGFFGLFAAAAATAIAVPDLELLLPKRTIFLPPVGGWVGRGNQLLSVEMISQELLRVFEQGMAQSLELLAAMNCDYDEEFAVGNRIATINIRRPPRYHKNAFQFTTADFGNTSDDRITFGGKPWRI